jgi:hypothetical protein
MDPGTNLLLQEGTKGTLKTTKYGGGFSATTLDQLGASSGGGGGRNQHNDDSDVSDGEYEDGYGGNGSTVRWGEDILLPPKGIVKPAWTRERFNDSPDIFDVEASLKQRSGGERGGASRSNRR